ncbi:MAG: DUF4261 domain-containing protein [Lawsonibacter sp.]|nr:DUF4261 domain-containing protein [Lawsonibacter sp.]MCI8914403.1 DUF4261 domain-containing protein [Lawsonibacter sp.]
MDKFRKKPEKTQEAKPEEPLDLEGKEQPVYFMWLLFDHTPQMPALERMQQVLEKKYGQVDLVSGGEARSFAVPKHMAQFQDGKLPSQVVMFPPQPFDQAEIGSMERSQLWNVPKGDKLLERATHKILLSDMMAVMDYPQRCAMLMDYLEAAVELFPDCLGVWFPHAWKLFTAEQVRSHKIPREDRFVYFGVNVRLFNIQGSEDKILDSLGMYAMGLPDVQFHFHTLNPDVLVMHTYNLCSYIFAHNAPIKSGETVDGVTEDGQLSRDIQWRCQYEDAIVAPKRELMDVCPSPYAAGGRQ